MKSENKNHGAGQSAKRTMSASHERKQSDKPAAAADITQLTGIATYDQQTGSFLFEPSDVAYGRLQGYILHGVGQQLTDGTLLFNPVTRKRYQGLRIAKLPHGWVNMTRNANIYLALSVPMNHRGDVGLTLYTEAADAAIAVNKFLRNVACNCGKPIDQLTWDDVAANAAFLGTKSQKDLLGNEKTKSERGEKPFGDAAPETNSQRCEETSSKTSQEVERRNVEEAKRQFEEAIQDYLDTEGVGDNNTTTDHIIYFGIQAQAEGYVAERTSTRSVKEPNDGSTDDAPFSEDLTQGGEVLPTVRRERSDYNYKKQNNCNCTTTGASKSKSSRSKHTDNQHFRIGGDC